MTSCEFVAYQREPNENSVTDQMSERINLERFLCFLETDISQERYVKTIVFSLVSQNPPLCGEKQRCCPGDMEWVGNIWGFNPEEKKVISSINQLSV